MSLLLDAGAFVAIERGEREVVAIIKRERLAGRAPMTHGGIVAQIWRGGAGRQAELARLLKGVDTRSLDSELGRTAGILLGRSQMSDAIDAALVCLAADGDEILTSDPNDLLLLAKASGVHMELVPV